MPNDQILYCTYCADPVVPEGDGVHDFVKPSKAERERLPQDTRHDTWVWSDTNPGIGLSGWRHVRICSACILTMNQVAKVFTRTEP